jgi:very-short-patch-repair endonuclease
VIVGHSGPLSADQRRRVGLIFGGPHSMLSHRSAAAILGLRVREHDVEITVPHGHPRPNTDFVRVHQSTRLGSRVIRGGLPCSSPARTVVDVACDLRNGDDVRALVSDAVQRGFATVAALSAEIRRCPRHNPALLRAALADVAAGARSAGEAAFLRLVRRAGLPLPELNVVVRTPGGVFRVDALWREFGVAVEIDGAAWHLGAVPWEHDLHRQNLLQSSGLLLLRFPVRRLRDDPSGVLSELRSALKFRAA